MGKKMSKRLLIAKDAMCAIISATNLISEAQTYNFERIVSDAYKLADELLKQED